MTVKFNKNVVAEATVRAKELEQTAGGAHSLTVHRGRELLEQLGGMKGSTTAQKSTLTRVTNRLTEALTNARVDPGARGLHPPGQQINVDTGRSGVIFKIRADDPIGGNKISKDRLDQVRLAVQMQDLGWDDLKKDGKPPWDDPRALWAGATYEKVTIRDDRPRDGAATFIYVKKPEVNNQPEFFMAMETMSRAGSKSVWGGPFPMGDAGHPKALQFQGEARDFAMKVGYPLSRSDALTLKDIKTIDRSGAMELKFDVHHTFDGKEKHGTVTVKVSNTGKFMSGAFKKIGSAGGGGPAIGPLPGTHLAGKMREKAFEFAEQLGMPMLRGHMGPNARNTQIEFSNIKPRRDGFEVLFDTTSPKGQLHVSVDKEGKLQAGYWEIGGVPQKIEKKLDTYGEIFELATRAGKKSGHRVSKSHTVDLVGVSRQADDTFRAVLHVNHWRTGEAAWMVNVVLDKEGKYKEGGVSQH